MSCIVFCIVYSSPIFCCHCKGFIRAVLLINVYDRVNEMNIKLVENSEAQANELLTWLGLARVNCCTCVCVRVPCLLYMSVQCLSDGCKIKYK